jgi:hypothetical protein
MVDKFSIWAPLLSFTRYSCMNGVTIALDFMTNIHCLTKNGSIFQATVSSKQLAAHWRLMVGYLYLADEMSLLDFIE